MKTPKALYLVRNTNTDSQETFFNAKEARAFYNAEREDAVFWEEDKSKITLHTYSLTNTKRK